MIDDYQYIPTPIAQKNRGPFGFGGKPMEGSQGFSGSIVDSGPNYTIPPIEPFEFPSGLGLSGPPGPPGATGATGPLLDGNLGDIIYHNGSTWVGLGRPQKGSILAINQYGNPYWLFGQNDNDLLYYRETGLTGWTSFTSPPSSGTFVFGAIDGQLRWIETTDCGATGA